MKLKLKVIFRKNILDEMKAYAILSCSMFLRRNVGNDTVCMYRATVNDGGGGDNIKIDLTEEEFDKAGTYTFSSPSI